MSYLCESIEVINAVSYGVNCTQAALFEMTPEVRDELLKFIIKVFVIVFVAKKVISIFR
jgi:hypothetical protein